MYCTWLLWCSFCHRVQIGWLISLWFSVLTLFVVCAHKLPLIHTQDSFNTCTYTQVCLNTHKFSYIHTSFHTYTHAVAACFYLYTACNCFCHRPFLFLRTLCVQDIICCPSIVGIAVAFQPLPTYIDERQKNKASVVVKWRAEMLQGREIRSLWVGIQFEYTFGKWKATNSP